MSGELITQEGASGWVVVAAGLVLSAGIYTQVSASTFADLLAATEENYPEFDIRLQVTSGTPTENVVVDAHLRMGDALANLEPAPNGNYAPHRVGGVTLDNTTGYFFETGLALLNKHSQLYLKSNEASTALTVSVSILAKTVNSAA